MVDDKWEFGVLGPLEVRQRGNVVRIKSQKQRAVLAILLLHANRVVGVASIVDGLWGENPPPTAGAALQVHVASLRKALGSDASGRSPITTQPPGYVIAVDSDCFDLARFEDLARRGRAELESAKPSEASALLGRALMVWRGAALADVASEPFALPVVTRLGEERLSVLADRFDADLERGAHAQVVGELREVTAEHPLRERFWEQLMLALYRCGNQAEALAAFRSARATLLDELGLEPGSALRALETAVLDQSSDLEWSPSGDVPSVAASTVLESDSTHRNAHLEQGDRRVKISGRTTIGRHPVNAVVLDDVKISREHAVIRATDRRFLLTDLHSTNGTFVNDEKVDEVTLVDGDRITIGPCVLVFHIDDD